VLENLGLNISKGYVSYFLYYSVQIKIIISTTTTLLDIQAIFSFVFMLLTFKN